MMAPYEVKLAVMMVVSAAGVSITAITAWTVVKLQQRRQPPPGLTASSTEERLARLEQTLDAVALEMERSSEAQRFTARLLAERLGDLPPRVAERVIAQPRPNNTPH